MALRGFDLGDSHGFSQLFALVRCPRTALSSGTVIPDESQDHIALHPPSVLIHFRQIELGNGIAGLGRPTIPMGRAHEINAPAYAAAIQPGTSAK